MIIDEEVGGTEQTIEFYINSFAIYIEYLNLPWSMYLETLQNCTFQVEFYISRKEVAGM